MIGEHYKKILERSSTPAFPCRLHAMWLDELFYLGEHVDVGSLDAESLAWPGATEFWILPVAPSNLHAVVIRPSFDQVRLVGWP